jgi:hypothetical protein
MKEVVVGRPNGAGPDQRDRPHACFEYKKIYIHQQLNTTSSVSAPFLGGGGIMFSTNNWIFFNFRDNEVLGLFFFLFLFTLENQQFFKKEEYPYECLLDVLGPAFVVLVFRGFQ